MERDEASLVLGVHIPTLLQEQLNHTHSVVAGGQVQWSGLQEKSSTPGNTASSFVEQTKPTTKMFGPKQKIRECIKAFCKFTLLLLMYACSGLHTGYLAGGVCVCVGGGGGGGYRT